MATYSYESDHADRPDTEDAGGDDVFGTAYEVLVHVAVGPSWMRISDFPRPMPEPMEFAWLVPEELPSSLGLER